MIDRVRLCLTALFVIPLVIPWPRGPMSARADPPAAAEDERAIRLLIQKADEGKPIKWTENRIFASALTPTPLVGKSETLSSQKREAVLQQRRNSKTRTTVERLVVAGSRDLAYEFSNFHMEWDRPDGRHTGFNGSLLRVWRKRDGQWLAEAMFARPNEATPREEEKER